MGLDLAPAHTGICIMNEHALPLRLITIDSPFKKRKKIDPPITEASRIERNLKLADEILGLIKTFKVRAVAIEDYAYGKVFQAHRVGETGGVVKSQLWLGAHIVGETVSVMTARKHLLGYGSAKKEDVLEIVSGLVSHLGKRISSDHESDAYVIAHWLFNQQMQKAKQEAK
jgi:Holliday junction resolvasome RuvABC endonuclease subunit